MKMKILLQLCTLISILIMLSCDKKPQSNYIYPRDVEKYNLYSKFDSAVYLIYKLNVNYYLGTETASSNTDTTIQYVQGLLSATLFNGVIKYSNDTSKFCLLLIDKKGKMIEPLRFRELVNTIGFIKDSIKFIEINDGVISKIDNQNDLFIDKGFKEFVDKNKSYISEDLKRVLTLNK